MTSRYTDRYVLPEFGFGDPTSYRLIEDVVDTLVVCGAVRHGAECFNFGFPQELDPDFLVIWDGYIDTLCVTTFARYYCCTLLRLHIATCVLHCRYNPPPSLAHVH